MSVRFSADRNFRVQRHHGVFFQRIGKFSVGGNAGFVGTRPFDRRVFRGDIFRQKQIVHDRVAAHGIGNMFQFVCEQRSENGVFFPADRFKFYLGIADFQHGNRHAAALFYGEHAVCVRAIFVRRYGNFFRITRKSAE